MIWLQVDDIEQIEKALIGDYEYLSKTIFLNSQLQGLDVFFLSEKHHFLIEPSIDELRESMRERVKQRAEQRAYLIVLSFNAPFEIGLFKNRENHPFLWLQLRSIYSPAKKIEFQSKLSREKILSEKLGFKMVKPKVDLENVAGIYDFKEYIYKISSLSQAGIPSTLKSLFLFGTAGSGKTHVAEAIAHHFGYQFGYLDIPHFMTLSSPTHSLGILFDYLEEQEQKCVLLIDEIEKMFDFGGNDLKSRNVFGNLLTRLNNIHTNPKSNIIFIATANDITNIVRFTPEFLRKGRFDEVFFFSYPTKKATIDLMTLFINKVSSETIDLFESMYKRFTQNPKSFPSFKKLFDARKDGLLGIDEFHKMITFSIDDFPPHLLFEIISHKYTNEMKVSDDREFIYAPPEINVVIKELQKEGMFQLLLQLKNELAIEEITPFSKMLLKEDAKIVDKIIGSIAPLQIYAKEGIEKQIAQAENYSGNGDDEYTQYRKG